MIGGSPRKVEGRFGGYSVTYEIWISLIKFLSQKTLLSTPDVMKVVMLTL